MIAIVASKTDVVKLKKILQGQQIAAEIIQTPERLNVARGCSFALKFHNENLFNVQNAAKKANVIVVAIKDENA